MLQHSKIIRSRDNRKKKSSERATEVRELKKTKKRLKKQIGKLKEANKAMIRVPEQDKKNS